MPTHGSKFMNIAFALTFLTVQSVAAPVVLAGQEAPCGPGAVECSCGEWEWQFTYTWYDRPDGTDDVVNTGPRKRECRNRAQCQRYYQEFIEARQRGIEMNQRGIERSRESAARWSQAGNQVWYERAMSNVRWMTAEKTAYEQTLASVQGPHCKTERRRDPDQPIGIRAGIVEQGVTIHRAELMADLNRRMALANEALRISEPSALDRIVESIRTFFEPELPETTEQLTPLTDEQVQKIFEFYFPNIEQTPATITESDREVATRLLLAGGEASNWIEFYQELGAGLLSPGVASGPPSFVESLVNAGTAAVTAWLGSAETELAKRDVYEVVRNVISGCWRAAYISRLTDPHNNGVWDVDCR